MYTPPDVFRSAIRLTREHPAFVALVSLILGVGIGATSAALNVARSVVFTPLPVADESRLVLIAKTTTNTAVLMPFSYAEIAAWRDSTHTLETVAGVQYDGAWPWPAQFHDRAFSVTGAMVTGDFFAALGARPVLGRLLTPDDAKVGSDEVAVLGYTLWRGQFGGDPRILGQRIRLNGHAATIIGVARDDFAFPRGTQVWQPLIATPDVLQEGWFTLVARLKPNVTVQQTAEESSMLLERLRSVGPRRFSQEVRPRVMSLRDAIVGDIRPVTALFVGAAAVLYLVGCINVLILLLIRGAEPIA